MNAVADGGRGQHQRERILHAAQQCFIERGFHAASMAHIAETAGMSAGLIYRYFASKNEIILAIIAKQVEERRSNLATMGSTGHLVPSILELFERWRVGDPDTMNAALFLEMSAEASRDPQIGAALRAADDVANEEFCAWLARASAAPLGADGKPGVEIAQRALILACLVEGLAVRVLRQPDLDSELLRASLERALPRLLSA